MKLVASGERVTETQLNGGITKLWYPFRTLGLESPVEKTTTFTTFTSSEKN